MRNHYTLILFILPFIVYSQLVPRTITNPLGPTWNIDGSPAFIEERIDSSFNDFTWLNVDGDTLLTRNYETYEYDECSKLVSLENIRIDDGDTTVRILDYFYENDTISKRISRDQNDEYVWDFDENGRLLSYYWKHVYFQYVDIRTYHYEYDEDGELIYRKFMFTSDLGQGEQHLQEKITRYEYDTGKNLIRKKVEEFNNQAEPGMENSEELFTYDYLFENDQPRYIEEYLYDTLYREIYYEYDSLGNLAHSRTVPIYFSNSNYVSYTNFYNDGLLSSRKSYTLSFEGDTLEFNQSYYSPTGGITEDVAIDYITKDTLYQRLYIYTSLGQLLESENNNASGGGQSSIRYYSPTILSPDCLTSTNEAGLEGLMVFPNPVLNDLTIVTELSISEVGIYDLNGKQIKLFKDTVNLNLTSLLPGIYVLHAKEKRSGKIYSQKLIKI